MSTATTSTIEKYHFSFSSSQTVRTLRSSNSCIACRALNRLQHVCSLRIVRACPLPSPYLSFRHVSSIDFAHVPLKTWWETAFVVFFGTYVSYILMMNGQRTLRPTVVSIYNYVQPMVSVFVSVMTGIGVLMPSQGLAVVLVCLGVWLVTKSRSRADSSVEPHLQQLSDRQNSHTKEV